MPSRSEADLDAEREQVEAAKKDPAAFQQLYDRYFDRVYSYVYYHCGNREQAEDITAATFQKGLEELPNFQWRGIPYSAWLYRVAANQLSRERRRPAWLELQDSGHAADEAGQPEDMVVRLDQDVRLRQAIQSLPADQRQAILLRFFAGMRNREVGRVMNRSEGAVKLLVFRAVANLRRVLADEEDGE
ncbi:MAG: sigma-70 family RNA polymerase sigma factor [Candidatus Dormibacteria bacterium]